jgi:hypothetical protein
MPFLKMDKYEDGRIKAALIAALYFPQFHFDPTLDSWFGKGGLDWENVRATKPRFEGHNILRPGSLGEYDLSLSAGRIVQKELALSRGIGAFCYYHYWSDGDRVLDVVERSILGGELEEEMPFFICWANHDWYDRDSKGFKKMLRRQKYSLNSWSAHAEYLSEMFSHPAYMHFNDRPLLLVYQPLDSLNLIGWTETIKQMLHPAPFLLGVEWKKGDRLRILQQGFDGSVAPIPHLSRMSLPSEICNYLGAPNSDILVKSRDLDSLLEGYIEEEGNESADDEIRIPTTYVGWDNSPRRRIGAKIVVENGPREFEGRIFNALHRARANSQPLVLVNSWNEWGEGSVLEPTREFGNDFLKALGSAKDRFQGYF